MKAKIIKKTEVRIEISPESETPKYQQLVNTVNNLIAENKLHIGDQLPSVNNLCESQNLSRDTVFKAYTILKNSGVVEAVANKGYFIAKENRKVFLMLDTFKAYKEVLYDSFQSKLPENVMADVHFHHYNIEVFSNLIHDSIGKYTSFVIMPFKHKSVRKLLSLIPKEKLLIIDYKPEFTHHYNAIYQNFGESFYNALADAVELIKKYKKFTFIYPNYTSHPIIAVEYFEKFCTDHNITYEIIRNHKNFKIEKGNAYISVSNRMLANFLEQAKAESLEPGVDVGFISYNETPTKKFIYKGITVISTNFEKMGETAAEFVSSEEKKKTIDFCIPTKLIIRESI